MLHQDALVITRQHRDLRHRAVKHGLHRRIRRHRYVDAVVRRQLEILENRMILLAETTCQRSRHRPRQNAAIGHELVCQLIIHRRLRLGRRTFPGRFRRGSLAAGTHRLVDRGPDLPLQGIRLPPLRRQILLVLRLLLGQRRRQRLRLLLLRLQLLHIRHPLRLQLPRIRSQHLQRSLFLLQLRLGSADLRGLDRHLGRKILEETEPPEALCHIVGSQDIHEPDPGIAVLVGTLDQAAAVGNHRIQPRLQHVDLLLPHRDGIFQDGDFPVTFLQQRLPRRDLAPHQRQARKGIRVACRIVLDLLVQHGDLLLQPGLARLLFFHVLAIRNGATQAQARARARVEAQTEAQANAQQRYDLPVNHCPIAFKRSDTRSSRSGTAPSPFFALARFQYTRAVSYSFNLYRTSA